MEGFSGLGEPVRSFIAPHVDQRADRNSDDRGRRYSPLGYLIRAAFHELADEDPPDVLWPIVKAGAVDLYRMVVGKPDEFHLAGGHTQYVIGYEASDTRLIPHDEAERVIRWNGLLYEAFILAGAKAEAWDVDKYNEFTEEARRLIAELALIAVESDNSWQAITAAALETSPA